MADRRIRVSKPGSADRAIHRRELADHIAAGWFPVWDQSIETLSTQVGVLRDAVVDLAGQVENIGTDAPPTDDNEAPGQAGADAYEVAVAEGFQGTRAEWLASLVGPPGPPGDDGAPGQPGANSTVPGPPGNDGTPGKDAYEIARDLGYGGTRTQWLATLVGAQGAKGDPGDPGTNGLGFTAATKLAADHAPFTTVNLTNITGLAAPLAANTAYKIDALIALTSAALTTGWQLGITGPAGAALVATVEYQTSATAWATATLQALGAFPLVTAAYAIAPTQILARITGVIATAGAAGQLQLQARSEIAGSAITVKRGSTLTLT